MLELSQSLLADLGGWPVLKEARVLVDRGKVLEVKREGADIRARVQGPEKIFEPHLTLADRASNVEVRCTCAESRRHGRVCAHAMAAGLALLFPARVAPRLSNHSGAGSASAVSPAHRLPRVVLAEAAPGTPLLELTVILPLQLKEAFARDPIHVILEARLDSGESFQPLDALLPAINRGVAVSEEDDLVLSALERSIENVAGVNAISRAKLSTWLRSLNGHPHVWLGKKQRVTVRAAAERPRVTLASLADGSLQMDFPHAEKTGLTVLSGWTFDGAQLVESMVLPAGLGTETTVIAREKIPDFLARLWPQLERDCEITFGPGFEEFALELGCPSMEARLDGALSGLTLELVAYYQEQAFSLDAQTAPAAYQRYVPDRAKANCFWRRNILAERAALRETERAGFSLVRGHAFSLNRENEVARFLANTLPRWRQNWAITIGPRLKTTLGQIDIAEPEFAFRRSSGEDWLGLDLKLSVAGKPVPLDAGEIQRWLQTGQSHARTANNRVLLIPTEAWGQMREVLADCDVEQEPGSMRVQRTFAPYVAGALAAQGFRGAALADGPPPEVESVLPPDLWNYLRPYQAHGVEWLAGLAQRQFHGLLADDMGLGKTLQALAFAAWLHQSHVTKEGPMLVVCPTSLVTNWLREAARFTPHLRTLDLTGADRATKFATRSRYDLLVTSYAILRRDIELYRQERFHLLVLDEAQHIKNIKSQNALAAKAVPAQHRLVLTGTPLENSVLDLWSIFDFLLPGYLGTAADFRERYETPLTKGPEPQVMERLRQRVKPFFLRRTKVEVLTELPPKLDFPTLCELSDEQQEVYRAVLAQGRREVFEHSGKAGGGRDRMAVLTTLLRLRQVCCHLDLLPQSETKRVWKEPSAKMERTFELIDEARDGGHRVLLFSQFVRVLHLLRGEAMRRGISFCYLDGQTVERQAEVDRFQQNENIPLFFISLKAGGTGLNLTGADTVIHFDPWWNPAVEEQATARAHRMGQARSVQAYKLIAAGTVEEKIQALQTRKRELFEASVGGDAALMEKLTGEDLEELLA